MTALNLIYSGITAGILMSIPLKSHGEVWSLDRCVEHAIEHNISVRQQNLQIQEGELAITEAKDRFLPSLDASASQSFNLGRGLTANNTYADRNTSNTQWSVGLSLPLFQGTSEYQRLKLARLSLQQYVLEKESTKDNIALNVMAQYLQVLYCKEVAKSARSQAQLSEFEVERQKALIEAGRVAEATLYDLEAVASQDRLQVVTADNDTQTALVNLANLLQLKSVEGFDVEELDGALPPLHGPDVIYASALAVNNGVKGARQGIMVADRNISLAKTGYIPTLSFSAGIGSSYYSINGVPGETFASQMKNNFSTYFAFSLRIPIFDGFNTRNGIRRAKLQKLSSELTLQQRESDLYKEIQLAYYQAAGARERFQTSQVTLEKTRLSFDATRERFNLGRATQADYEQAKNNLYKTEISLIQSQFEYLLRARILHFYSTNSWK